MCLSLRCVLTSHVALWAFLPQFLPAVQENSCSLGASLQHLISTNLFSLQDSCKPHLCSGASLKLLAASQAQVQLHQPPQTHIPPRALLAAGRWKAQIYTEPLPCFTFLLTVWLPVACNYFGMLVLMMCPVHLACSSVLLVICCFFVSCLPKGHYIISKTEHKSSIIYQARFAAHLSLISRPCSIHTSQPSLGHEAPAGIKQLLNRNWGLLKAKLAVLQTGIWYHFKPFSTSCLQPHSCFAFY